MRATLLFLIFVAILSIAALKCPEDKGCWMMLGIFVLWVGLGIGITCNRK